MSLQCIWISFGNTDLNRLTHFLYGAQNREHTKVHLSHIVNILYTDWQGNVLMNNAGRPTVLSLRPS